MKCLQCQGETSNPKFCSRSCAASFNNKIPKRTKIIKQKSQKKIIIKEHIKSGSERVSDYRRRMKLKSVEYLGGKCIICGYDKCLAALDFHHRDPKEKDFAIGTKVHSWDLIVKELDKCDLLCSNCHRELHNS